jgi:zinc protease
MTGSPIAKRASVRGVAPGLAVTVVVGLLAAGCQTLGLGRTPAWEEPPPPIRHTPVVQPGALTRAELDNGLTVLVLEDHRLPRVTLAVTVRRGAGAVDPAQAGLAQLTAELMNRGAGERDALALAQTVDDLGASLSVRADWDAMEVSVSGLAGDLDVLFEILHDVALAPRLDAVEAEKARAEHLAGLQAARDDPGTLAQWLAMRVLYPDHRYGLPLDGTQETVAALDVDAARALHARYFVARNAILSVAGDVTATDVLRRARGAFGDWDPGILPPDTPPPPERTPAARRIVIGDEPSLVQARVILAHEGLARTDPRRTAASVMNATLGGSGFSARLMQSLRSEEGLTYGVGSFFAMRGQPGPFVVSTFTRVPETRRAVEMVLAETEAIRGPRPQTPSELADAKSFLVGQFGLGLETSEAVMAALVDLSVFGLPDDSLDTYRARVDAVTVAETAEIADTLLHPSRAAIVLLGPAEALAPQMEELGEVEVVVP